MPSVITSDHLVDNVKVFDNLFPVYIHMHMCIQVHGGLHLCMSAHVKAKCQHFSSQTVHLIFLSQKLSLVWNLPSRVDCLATKLQFSVNFYFPIVEYASLCHLSQLFHMGSEHQTQLLMFAQPMRCQLYYLFSPKLRNFFDQNAQNLVGELQFPQGSV